MLILLTGTSWRPVNTPTTNSSGKLNLLGVGRGRRARVRSCNYRSGQPADPRGPRSCTECVWRRFPMVLFQGDFTPDMCCGALHFSSLFWSITPDFEKKFRTRLCHGDSLQMLEHKTRSSEDLYTSNKLIG